MDTVIATAREKMGKTISVLKSEYNSIRAGRANAAVLDKIRVCYYGVPTPIQQMAAVSVAEARILCIQPWDVSTLHTIEKAIQISDIGINPQNDGRVIRLIFPQLTEEKRKELAKAVRKTAEEANERALAGEAADGRHDGQRQQDEGLHPPEGNGVLRLALGLCLPGLLLGRLPGGALLLLGGSAPAPAGFFALCRGFAVGRAVFVGRGRCQAMSPFHKNRRGRKTGPGQRPDIRQVHSRYPDDSIM